MKELKRNTQLKVINIRESCGLSDLKRHGYEQAEQFKKNYQLDMILHVHISGYQIYDIYFSLLDLNEKKVKEVSIAHRGVSTLDLEFRGILKKLLISGDINRVLRAKKKALAK
jgi:hypothetical protein